MNLATIVKLYFLTVPVFFLIDMLWIGVIARGFYKRQLGHVLSSSVNWPAAILFYLVFIGGILIFAVLPALKSGSLGRAILWGALFGFFTYATYDLTNLATIRSWSLVAAIVDILWGICLCTAVSTAGFFIGRWLA